MIIAGQFMLPLLITCKRQRNIVASVSLTIALTSCS